MSLLAGPGLTLSRITAKHRRLVIQTNCGVNATGPRRVRVYLRKRSRARATATTGSAHRGHFYLDSR